MRRTSARIAQLRAHLRRRRHDVQAQAALDALLLAKPDRVRGPLDDILASWYSRSFVRKLSRNRFRSDLAAVGKMEGIAAWIPVEAKP